MVRAPRRRLLTVTVGAVALALVFIVWAPAALDTALSQVLRRNGVDSADLDRASSGQPMSILVVGSAAVVIATGMIIGLGLSALFGRLLSSLLFGVQPLDPATFAAVTLVLAITGAAAVAGPAWRAIHIDPVTALRNE